MRFPTFSKMWQKSGEKLIFWGVGGFWCLWIRPPPQLKLRSVALGPVRLFKVPIGWTDTDATSFDLFEVTLGQGQGQFTWPLLTSDYIMLLFVFFSGVSWGPEFDFEHLPSQSRLLLVLEKKGKSIRDLLKNGLVTNLFQSFFAQVQTVAPGLKNSQLSSFFSRLTNMASENLHYLGNYYSKSKSENGIRKKIKFPTRYCHHIWPIKANGLACRLQKSPDSKLLFLSEIYLRE